jgi:hypothetical protein
MSISNILVPNPLTLYLSDVNTIDPYGVYTNNVFTGTTQVGFSNKTIYTFSPLPNENYYIEFYVSAYCTAGTNINKAYSIWGIYTAFLSGGTANVIALFNRGTANNSYYTASSGISYSVINSNAVASGSNINFNLSSDGIIGTNWSYSWSIQIFGSV